MTTDYMLFVAGLGSYIASKGYKRWSGVIEINKLPNDKEWGNTRLDKTRYAQILTTKPSGDYEKNILK